MKGAIVVLLAAATGIVIAQLPATAQNRVSSKDETSQRQQPLAPRIAHVRVRATLLHWGMSPADITRAMAAPPQVDAADDEGTVHVLRYSAAPMATTVTVTDGKLSGVALDVAGVEDPALPNFARAAWLGMKAAASSFRTAARSSGTASADARIVKTYCCTSVPNHRSNAIL